MSETRKLAAILVSDVVGYSRLTGADEDRILARMRALRSDLIDPTIAVHHGRVVKGTGDGAIVEFRSVVDAVNCAIEVQRAMIERNDGVAPDKRIEFRIGIHLGDVVEESDGDLMGDGVNIAARLEGIAKPGAICLSSAAYEQVRDRFKERFVDLGEKELKNIARPVRAYSLQVGVSVEANPSKAATPKKPAAPKRRTALALLGIAALLLVIGAGGGYWFMANRPAAVAIGPLAPVASNAAEAKHLSIVVLPFANLSGDPAQEYFADGVTESLTTDLSRIRNSFVIARNTAFTYKGKNLDAKAIGKELGVRYVLEGSVQRDQSRVSINAQLIDAESGAHLWADRFEDDVADLLDLQDQVVARLANSLGNELIKAEAEKGGRSRNPDAIDLIMRGRALQLNWWQQPDQQTKKNNNAIRALFEQALSREPDDADALAGDALTYAFDIGWGWREPGTNYDTKALGQANRAIELAPDNVWGHIAKSAYLQYANRNEEGLRAADAGIAINPNSALLYAARVNAQSALGRFDEAKADALKAMQLSPRDPQIGLWHVLLGDAELGLKHYDEAVGEYRKDLDIGNHTDRYIDIAAAYALAGKMDEARAAVARALRASPSLTLKSLTWTPPKIPEWTEALRKAGLPEE